MPADFAWQALDAQGARATSFSVDCNLTVSETANGSSARAWVNASVGGAVPHAGNGTFSIPSTAWSGGFLNLSVSVIVAEPVSVRLFGPLLPTLPTPVALTVLPDLAHLALGASASVTSNVSNDTYWAVHDRFGNPAPGALLVVDWQSGSSVNTTFVPVTGSGGTTGAWVNYTIPETGSGSLEIRDEAGAVLWGPVVVSASTSPTSSSSATLSPLALTAVGLLAVGAVVGMTALLTGGRPRPSSPSRTDDEELQRLAEGRETVVEIVRRKGPVTLREIEAAWEPSPAPPAVSDWVASLVTDGTLTVELGSRGEAQFALAERLATTPSVTLDEEALERGIARRDAAVEPDDESAP